MNETPQTSEFCLAADVRRAAMWAIGGSLLVPVVMWCVNGAGRPPGAGPWWHSAIPFLLIAAWLTQHLLPRIKVDEEGVHRRIAWWWDLWPWEAFLSGQVRTGCARYTYEFPTRAFWRRKLNLGYLEEPDAESIRELIGRLWTERPPETVPETLILRLKSGSRRIELAKEGIVVRKKQQQFVYSWDDVQDVEIWRTEHDRRDFRELEIQLPDQRVKMKRWTHQGQDHCNWTEASSEVIAGMVQEGVDPDLVRVFSLHGRARTLEEIDRRQARDSAQRAEVERVMKWCVRVMWAMTAAMPLMFPWPGSLGMVFLTGLLAVAMQWMYRDINGHYDECLREHDQQRAVLLESQDCCAQ